MDIKYSLYKGIVVVSNENGQKNKLLSNRK